MSTISLKMHFAAGHRILGLTGPGAKCSNVHGHTFHLTWTFDQAAGNMALEFGSVKQTLKTMVYELFDHGFFVDRADDFRTFLRASKLKYYTLNGPPTTELIAQEIAVCTKKALPKAPLRSVELWEGPENCATWTRSTSITEIEDYHGKVVQSVIS